MSSVIIERIRSDRLRKECLHLGISSVGLSRNELISELHGKGLYEIDLRFPAKPPLIDTSNRIDDLSNVFVGNGAGLHETRSDRLCIANNDTDEPLLGGDFKNKRVEVHDTLNIRDTFLKRYDLTADTPGEEGDLRRSGADLYMYRKTTVHPGWYPVQFGSVMIF
jgi:hypothetical protein